MSYGKSRVLDASFDDVVAAVRASLADQGFGVLTEIDVQDTMRTKLGEEVGPFVILGACNPPLAHRALDIEPALGLLLPCNITVRQPVGSNCPIVEVIDPRLLVAATGNEALEPVAVEAGAKLDAALTFVERHLPDAVGGSS